MVEQNRAALSCCCMKMSGAAFEMCIMRAQGRILVFEVRDRKLHMLAEKETRGAVYNLAHFQVRKVPASVPPD